MEHPFFDNVAYPWNRSDAQELHRLLVLTELPYAGIDLVYKKCAEGLPPLTMPANATNLWKEVLTNLSAKGALRALLIQVSIQFAASDPIMKAVNAIQLAKPAVDIKFVSTEIFILDCEIHREAISKMTSDAIAKTVLVRGLPKSGKSHCRHLLKSVADEKGAEMLYICDGLVATVEEAIESIFSSIGYGPENIPTKVTTNDAWYRTVCNKLKSLAGEKKLWIAVDDLGYIDGDPSLGPILDTKIREFFEQFALFMLDPSFAKRFRLLLINYSEIVVPTKWKAQMWTETRTDEKNIQTIHVEEFLKEWSAYSGINIIEQELKQLAVQVIEQADELTPEMSQLCRLERIHTILDLKIDEIQRRAS